MRNYFTSLQVFLAGALAIVIFIGVLWAEQTNFNKISTLEDPFSETQNVSERVVVNGETPRSWLHQTGEVFMVMPGGKFNLTKQARELEEGVLFINTSYQDQAAIEISKVGFKPPYDLTQSKLGGGQVKIGPIVVGIPQGVAVLKRDLVRQEDLIYAHDHPVKIYIPKAEEPFIVPPGYMVLLKEGRAELLGSLFFTKLKKELSLELLESDSLGMESVQSALLQGLELSEAWEKQMIDYAQNQLVSTTRFAPSSVMGRLIRFLSYIQRYYALGIDRNFKSNYEYERLRDNLKEVYFYFLHGDKLASIKSSKDFDETRDSLQWARFFIESPSYNQQWNKFTRSQRIWFYGVFPGQLEVEALRILWGPSEALTSFKDFQDNLYLYEGYVSNGYAVAARSQLAFMLKNFENIDFEKLSDKNQLTQARRQISLLLQKNPQKSNTLIYQLYIKLVGSERDFAVTGTEADQEIRLEVAQELLFFLDELLDSKTRQEDVISLLEVYDKLDIGALADSLGRTVFNKRERDTLDRVRSIKDITPEERALINEDNRTVDDIIELRKQLKDKESENVVVVPLGIQTESELIELLNLNYIQSQGVKVQVNQKGENRFFTFSQVTYKGYPLTGTFDTERQQFTYLKLGEIEERIFVPKSRLTGFLLRMEKSNKVLKKEEPKEEDLGININTSSALIQRRNILEILNREGVMARFDKIIPTNETLTKARIEEASLDKTYLLNFDFDLGPPIRIRNVEAAYGRSVIIIPNRVFPLDDLEGSLLKVIAEKIEEQNKDE